jgi:hypothetical protein
MAQAIVRPQDIAWGGTSFPASPTTDDRWFRTDLGFDCYFDGTRWLTVQEYSFSFEAPYFAADGYWGYFTIPQAYINYFTRIQITVQTAAPNDGSNYWTILIYAVDGGWTQIATLNTSGDTANTHVSHSMTASPAIPANQLLLLLQGVATGSPGAVTGVADGIIFYRLIVT